MKEIPSSLLGRLPRALRSLAIPVAVLLIASCAEPTMPASDYPVLSFSVGDTIRINLGTVGPGEYTSPPSISSPAVQFIDWQYRSPGVPSGVGQQFRFRAAARGTAYVQIHHTGSNPTAVYIVNVL